MDPEILENLNRILTEEEIKQKRDSVTRKYIEENLTKITQEIKHEREHTSNNKICPELMNGIAETMKCICKTNFRSVSNNHKMIDVLKQHLSERQKQLENLEIKYNSQLEQSREKLSKSKAKNVVNPNAGVAKSMQKLEEVQAILAEENRISAQLGIEKRAKENAMKTVEQANIIEFAGLYVMRMKVEKYKLLEKCNKSLEQEEWRLFTEVQNIDNENSRRAVPKVQDMPHTSLGATLKPAEYYLNLFKIAPSKTPNHLDIPVVSKQRPRFNSVASISKRKRSVTPHRLDLPGPSGLPRRISQDKCKTIVFQDKPIKPSQSICHVDNDSVKVKILEQTIISPPRNIFAMDAQCLSLEKSDPIEVEDANSPQFDFFNMNSHFNADQSFNGPDVDFNRFGDYKENENGNDSVKSTDDDFFNFMN